MPELKQTSLLLQIGLLCVLWNTGHHILRCDIALIPQPSEESTVVFPAQLDFAKVIGTLLRLPESNAFEEAYTSEIRLVDFDAQILQLVRHVAELVVRLDVCRLVMCILAVDR